MLLMHFLRALSNLGLYYTFAGTVAGAFGASMALANLLAQSACFALSALLQRRRWARLAALAPAILLLLGVGTVDRLAALPGLAYLAYLAWQGEYSLRWGWQADVFSLLWKAFLPFAPLSALFGCQESIVTQGMPVFLTAAVSSVLLLRSIRHGPEIYCQRRYQARNWLAVALLLGGAWLASTDWSMACVGFVYTWVVVPVLLGIAMAVGVVCMTVLPLLLRLVVGLINLLFQKGGEPPPAMSSFDDILFKVQKMAGVNEGFGRDFLTALVILISAGAALWLFRWMVRRRPGPEGDASAQLERASLPEPPKDERPVLPGTYAGRVRSQYRRFLKLCQKNGVELAPADTSAEVSRKAAAWTADRPELEALEGIYRRARYYGQASREDVAEAKRLYAKLRKSMK